MGHGTRFGGIRPGWVVATGLAVVALVAVGVPLGGLLTFGVLLLCPLLMVGMHGGHRRDRSHGGHADGPDRSGLRDDGPQRAEGPTGEGGFQ